MIAHDEQAFWRNVVLIGLAHAAVLSALVRWSNSVSPTQRANILWMDGGAALQAAAITAVAPPMPAVTLPEDRDDEVDQSDDDATAQSSLPTEIPLPTSTARPQPDESPRPIAKPKPKPTPQPSAKPKPKKLVAKSSPKPRPQKHRATPAPEREATPPVRSESSPAPEVMNAIAAAAKNPAAPTVGISGTGAGGSTGHGVGGGAASQFGWYAHMLHDRFFSQWSQPTSVVRTGAKMSTLVKLRIEKDGRVSRFTILRPSGNVVVDESVAAVGKRVTQVDPLPAGLTSGGFYEVNINFELNSEL